MRTQVNENNVKTREDNAYRQKYGKIPDDLLERIAYILGNKAKNEKYNLEIQKAIKKIKRIKRHKIQFTLWKVVKPSARPRATMRAGYVQMYVPNAATAGKWFEEYFKQSDLPRIDTPCTLEITIYEQTPSAFNKKQTVLAELGLLRPWKRTGDFDNYAKTIADMLQHGMLVDDCLIISSRVELMYSIKPRCDIVMEYMDEFPSI
jgi:Holliday junction resolvase RusA-like endonuclease